MGRLEGKTALVTGASRGIGRAIVLELAREGAKVALNYQSNDAAAKEVADQITKDGGTCLLVKANLADPKQARGMVKKVAEQFGHLDILVNNAGITRDKQIGKMTDEEWLEVIQTNLSAVFFCTSAAIPIMTGQSFGRIVNIASMNGQVGAFGQANYSASKGGVIAFTRTAALELARLNITVNCVVPGYTDTDMFAKVPADIQAQIKAKIPLKRFAQPAEIARAVVYLVTDGDYVTGQQINVNGGAYM
jgi:NAD(P)-dependent dehydrogenase (short-subunit alcohol dehydrogenase family)